MITSNIPGEHMGRVVVPVRVDSLEDVYRVHRGELAADQVRRVDVPDALVDTGATTLSLPRRMIAALGLVPLKTRRVVTPLGFALVPAYGAVKLTLQGRDCVCDVMELDDACPVLACPVLVGQVPLELLDFLVDSGRRQLIGNPAHGGEQILEIL